MHELLVEVYWYVVRYADMMIPFVKRSESRCKRSEIRTKSSEILMFVRLPKDTKQCCDATKLGRTHCAGRGI